jgi:hypothetical protein
MVEGEMKGRIEGQELSVTVRLGSDERCDIVFS